MNISVAELIAFISFSVGLFLFLLGTCFDDARELILVLLGLVMALLPLQQLAFSIDSIPLNERVVVESRPIAEEGVTLDSSVSGFLWVRSSTTYVVMVEQDDGSSEALTMPAESVSVYEDVSSWDEAHVDKVKEGGVSYEGTFFGFPVKDTRESGGITTGITIEYHLHVPEGALSS